MKETKWIDYIGDINLGRVHLGKEMPVEVYRLFEFTMKDELTQRFGKKEAIEIFRSAGKRAGSYFTKQLLDISQDINIFMTELQTRLQEQKMGILRIEELDENARHIVVSIGEDLDCSGLPIIGESVCNYDEGFLMGVLHQYTGHEYEVIEVDCWAKGGRVCRFDAKRK